MIRVGFVFLEVRGKTDLTVLLPSFPVMLETTFFAGFRGGLKHVKDFL